MVKVLPQFACNDKFDPSMFYAYQVLKVFSFHHQMTCFQCVAVGIVQCRVDPCHTHPNWFRLFWDGNSWSSLSSSSTKFSFHSNFFCHGKTILFSHHHRERPSLRVPNQITHHLSVFVPLALRSPLGVNYMFPH